MNPWREGIPFWHFCEQMFIIVLPKQGNHLQHHIYRRLYPLLSCFQDVFPKNRDIFQEKSEGSMDSTSVWQKAHLSDSAISKRKSFSFVNTIRFNILSWNSLSFVSNIVRKDNKTVNSFPSAVCFLQENMSAL